MTSQSTPGSLLRSAIKEEKPLQMVGTINAYNALMATKLGFRALYISGAGVANASYGLPDLGVTGLKDVLEDVYRITAVTAAPVLVDIDTGWGNNLAIARTIKSMHKAGAAGVQIEDQQQAKRCGHRPDKIVVSEKEMVDRIKAAVDARSDATFTIVARSDAFAAEGLEATIERLLKYVAAGADVVFPEALTSLEHYHALSQVIDVPILANITEFGKTPLFTVEELRTAGVAIALYPLTAFRAMNAAALHAYRTILQGGSQQDLVDSCSLQTRDELYEFLDYYALEEKQDRH